MRLRHRTKISTIFFIAQFMAIFLASSYASQVSRNFFKEMAISVLIVSVSSLPSSAGGDTTFPPSVSSPYSLQPNSSEFTVNEGRSQSQFANVNVSLSLNDYDGKMHRTRTSRRFTLTKANPSFSLNKELKRKKTERRRKSRPQFGKTADTKPTQNFNEDIANLLRKNILSQLGDMDPLLCLPKALCGLSSRQSHMQTDDNSNPIGLGLDPTNEDVLSNYFQIMKTIVQQGAGSSSEKAKRKSKSTKTGFERDYYYYDDDDEGDSASLPSSEDSSEEMDDEDSRDTDDDNYSKPQEVTFFSDLDEDDLEYYREKKKMEKLMENDELNPQQNWWDALPSSDPYRNVYPDEKDPSEGSKWPQFSFMPSSFSSFVGSMMPSMAWGFGGKSPDVFSADPFFENFRSLGRSLDNGVSNPKSFLESLLGKRFASTLKSLPKEATPKRSQKMSTNRRAKMIPRRKKKPNYPQSYRINSKRKRLPAKSKTDSDKIEVINMDDPVERFQMAIEIGKKLKSPQQCEHVFNGCPFSYEEIVSIINLTKKNADVNNNLSEDINTETAESVQQVDASNSKESKAVVAHTTPSGQTYEVEVEVGSLSAQNASKTKGSKSPSRKKSKSKPKIPSSKSPSILPTHYTVYEPEGVTIYRTDLPSDSSQPTFEPEAPQTPAVPKTPTALQTPAAPTTASKSKSKAHQKDTKLRPLKKTKGKKSIRHKQWGRLPTKSSEYHFQDPHSKHVNHNDHPYPYEPVTYHSSSPTVTNYHYYHSNGPSLATTNYHPYPFETTTRAPHLENSRPTSSNPVETSTALPPVKAPFETSVSSNSHEPSSISSSAKPLSKGIRKGKKSPKKNNKKSSEERIVIRLTDASPTAGSHLNNFFNIIPLPFRRSLFSATAPEQLPSAPSYQQQPQQNQQQFPQQYYKPLLPSVSNYFPSLSSFQQYPTSPSYYPSNYQHHQPQYYPNTYPLVSPPPTSSSPMFPSVLSYVFGKKKKK